MGTAQEYLKAARNAHKAGDEAAARRLVQAARQAGGQSFGEKVGTFLNKAGEAMTMGLIGDEASAFVESLWPGVSYEDRLQHYRDEEAKFDRSNPALALAADVGGSLIAPVGALGTVARGASLAKKAAATGAAGAGMSGIFGFMEGEGGANERLSDARDSAVAGGILGAALPIVGSGVGAALEKSGIRKAVKNAAKNAPTSDQLRAQGTAAYDEVDSLGVQIKPEAFDRARAGILNDLQVKTGYDELPGPGGLTPKTARVMQTMDEAAAQMAAEPTAALPFRSVDQMRRRAGAAAGNIMEPADQQAGMQLISGLDDMINNLSPADVVSGDVAQLPGAIAKARDTWSKLSKSQKIDDAMEAAEAYRYGFSNGIKWQFKKILNSPKLSRGFSKAERKAMQRVIDGTIPEKLLDIAGSGLTQVGGIVGAGLGAASGGLPGAVFGLGTAGLSMAARAGSNAIARQNAEAIRGAVANGGLLQLPPSSTMVPELIERLGPRAVAGGLN